MSYRFQVATEAAHFQQIRRLNHRTFAEEIPQHEPNARGELVDGRETESTFIIALHGERVVGMIAVADRRPFSLEQKLPSFEEHLPAVRRMCELRLLSVEPEHRAGVVFHGLISALARLCLERAYELAVISGTRRQLRLYRHLGFVAFGPEVGTPEAPYQPMYLTLDALRDRERVLLHRRNGGGEAAAATLTAGPTEPLPEVMRALAAPAESHRGPAFHALLDDVRTRLRALTRAPHVQVMLGSGSLANDAVAAQLARLDAPGVVLVNGEFGERLADHARRWRLDARIARREWGEAFGREDVERALDQTPRPAWLWAVHCETSTSVLTDLDMLRAACRTRGIGLCLDAISSLGTLPVDLRGIAFATAAANKGLGSVPGLALVFHRDPVDPAPDRLPRYLDLGLYAADDGVPFTHSSPLLAALRAALSRFERPAAVFDATAADGAWLRASLRARGLDLVGRDDHGSPAVITIRLPDALSSEAVGEAMEAAGYRLGFRSGYLLRRNWLQVCLMGAYRRDCLAGLVDTLDQARRAQPVIRSGC